MCVVCCECVCVCVRVCIWKCLNRACPQSCPRPQKSSQPHKLANVCCVCLYMPEQGVPPVMPTSSKELPALIDWPALLAEVSEAGAAVPEVHWIQPGDLEIWLLVLYVCGYSCGYSFVYACVCVYVCVCVATDNIFTCISTRVLMWLLVLWRANIVIVVKYATYGI